MRVITTLSLVLLIAILTREAAADTCPLDTVSISASGVTHVWASPRDSLQDIEAICDGSCNYISGSARFDLVQGAFECAAYTTGRYVSNSRVSTHDVFTLRGPIGAPPIAFVVLGYATGDAQERSSVSVTLREGGANVASGTWGGSDDLSRALLVLHVTRAPGQTFDLYTTLEASGNDGLGHSSGGEVSFYLLFTNLPNRYSLESCQGFTTLPPVATLRQSWGHLKAAYR